MSANRVLKAAVIGVGASRNSMGKKGGGHQIGYTHARMFRNSPRCELEAGVDIDADNLAAFQRQFEVKQGFADVGQMLAELKPDLVSIGTYVGLHRRFVEQCARAGVKGIVCEKPFLASPADLEPVRRVVEATGVKIVVAHVRRYRPAFVRMRELVANHTVGHPIACISSLGGWDLSEMGSHWFDLMRYVNGDQEVQWVMGQARVGTTRGYGHCLEDHALAYFGFANGMRGIIEAGEPLPAGANSTLTLVGSAGVIRASQETRLSVETIGGHVLEDYGHHKPAGWERLGVASGGDGWNELWDMMLHDLIGWIEGGPAPRVAFETAIRTLEVNQAAYVSAIRGDRVDLPLRAPEVTEYPVDLLARRRGAQPDVP